MAENSNLINFNLFGSQVDFVSDLDTQYTAFVGGFRSGKTYSLMAKSVVLAANNPYSTGAICLPTHGMVSRGFKPEFEEFMYGHNVKFERLPAVNGYTLFFNKRPTRILLLSSENFMRARNLELSFFALDETDAMVGHRAWDAWNLFISRLSGGRIRRGFCVSTPEGFNFMYDTFMQQLEEKPELNQFYKLYRGSTADNINLPEDYIPALEAKYTSNLIKAYLHGEFVNLLSGNVYYAFNRRVNHTPLTLNDFPEHVLHIGQDFNMNQCSSVIHIINKGMPYALDEITGVKNTFELVSVLTERYPNRKIFIYPDASGNNNKTSASQSDLSILKKAGYELCYNAKNPLIKNRVNAMNSMLCNAKNEVHYYINTTTCRQYTKSLEQQTYDKSGMPDKSAGLDHLLDAAGYFINFRWPITQRGTITIT